MAYDHKEEASYSRVFNIKEEKSDLEFNQKIQFLTTSVKLEQSNVSGTNDNANLQYEGESDVNLSQDSKSSHDNNCDEVTDDKNIVEPVKSSNEILTELFKVFNAAPPDQLLNKSLIKKVKKHKKSKKKKSKKIKNQDNDCTFHFDLKLEQEDSKGKHKNKKKRKHKHKSKDAIRNREKYIERVLKFDKVKVKVEQVEHSDSNENKRSRDYTKNRKRKRPNSLESSAHRITSREYRRQHDEDLNITKSKRRQSEIHNDFYNGFGKDVKNTSDHRRNKYNRRSEERFIKVKSESFHKVVSPYIKSDQESEISDITLSDEETYLKDRERVRDSRLTGHKKDRCHNNFYASIERTCSKDQFRSSRDRDSSRNNYSYRDCSSRDRNRHRDHERERSSIHSRNSHYYGRHSRSRSRTRSRSRSRNLGIDKKRLLEIARKNAISMFKRGNLPGCNNMSQEVKDKVLLKMRYGGRTVEDLTEFCKKISKGEELSDLSSDEDSDVDKRGNTKAFHHPFQLKERELIVMNIRNSKLIVPQVQNNEQTKAITMQFPVSSGEQHRLTESWAPVQSKDIAPLPTLPIASQTTTVFKNIAPKNVQGKPLPVQEEQEPAFKPLPEIGSSILPLPPPLPIPLPNERNKSLGDVAEIMLPPTSEVGTNFVPDVPIPSSSDSVFPQPTKQSLDVSTIISKRLNAMRKLQENPLDPEAIKMMYNSQKEMTSWASSKHLPGQFTGSTGAIILKPSELNSGPQVWARKNQLTSTKPVTGGMGMQLLQKMGWKPGEGLGREKKGALQPLLLDVKLDKRGLVAQDDFSTVIVRKPVSIKKPKIAAPPLNIQDKHPVCLLNELTSKRKWTPPMYTLTHENGPSHSRMFLFSVSINGETFTPKRASNTKKEAKLLAAKNCLQQIGILPPD